MLLVLFTWFRRRPTVWPSAQITADVIYSDMFFYSLHSMALNQYLCNLFQFVLQSKIVCALCWLYTENLLNVSNREWIAAKLLFFDIVMFARSAANIEMSKRKYAIVSIPSEKNVNFPFLNRVNEQKKKHFRNFVSCFITEYVLLKRRLICSAFCA